MIVLCWLVVIAFSAYTIWVSRQASRNFRCAEENFKRTEENFRRAEDSWDEVARIRRERVVRLADERPKRERRPE